MFQIVSLLKDLWCPFIVKNVAFFPSSNSTYLVFQRHCDKSWPRHFYPSESEVALLYKKAIEKYFKMSFESALLKYWPEGWQLFGKKREFFDIFLHSKGARSKKLILHFYRGFHFYPLGNLICVVL